VAVGIANRRDGSREIALAYEVRGDPSADRRVLLVAGGQQLVGWPTSLLDALTARGYAVAIFDNRDVGLSTHLDDVTADLKSIGSGTASAPYLVADLAADALAVLDALGWDTAIVLGVSLGGMIAQQIAIAAPQRVQALVSVMSTTGDRSIGRPRPGVMSQLVNAPPPEREAYLEHQRRTWRAIGSPAFPPDDADLRQRAAAAFDRAYDPRGVGRQFGAILGSPDRTSALRALRLPALVVHGSDDPLVDVSGGIATAHALAGSTLLVIPGMGHDLPAAIVPQLVDAVDAVVAR
jgi:pimeloyl-ACP methyl ester carboxylesterase